MFFFFNDKMKNYYNIKFKDKLITQIFNLLTIYNVLYKKEEKTLNKNY